MAIESPTFTAYCKALDPGADVLQRWSFSKTLSPGLRIGWIAPGRHQEPIEYLKFVVNLTTPTVPQLAVAELLQSGGYDRHRRAIRGDYAR